MAWSRVLKASRWASVLQNLVARRRILGGAWRRATTSCLAFLFLLSIAQLFAAAAAWADIRYFYDSLGRLVRVLRDDGESATYYYDAIGNLLRITRESGAPQSTIVTSASPTTGGRDTTVALTITGDNLAGATLSSTNPGITFTNVRAGINQITADLGIALSAPLGPTTLTVRGLLGTVPMAFSVTVGPPRITSFTPLLGPAGTLVTIQGSQFDSQSPANNQVTFNGASAAVQSATDTTLVATVPASATSGPITVTTAAGSMTSAAAFMTGQVVIGAVAPETGQRGASLTLTVTGSNLLGASLSRPGMTVNTLTTTAGQITASVSFASDAVQQGTLTVTNQVSSASVPYFVLGGAPSISNFAPLAAAEGALVTINGTNFDERGPGFNEVQVNGAAAAVQTVTEQRLTILVPGGATSGPISVTTATGTATSATVFITGQVAATSVTPASAQRGSTLRLTVTGSNLLGSTVSRPGILFSNTVATATQVAADAVITLDTPREDVITVSNQVTGATIAFPVQPGVPTVTSFTPISGSVGDMVNVNGGGFDEVVPANNVVRFNGVQADIVSVTPTRIVTHVPTGATTGPVSVTTPLGTATSAQDFTVVAAAPLRLVTSIDAPFGLPISVVLRPDGLRAYVVNQDRDSVGVIDTATHTIIATIPVGAFPVHAAVSPDGARLYVVNTPTQSTADTVSVVDLTTNTVVTTITLAHSNRRGRAFVSPDGRTVLVTHPDQNVVSLIDATTATVGAVIATGTNPVVLAFTPDSGRAYINNASSNSVTVLDVVARTVAATILVSAGPTFGFMSGDGSRYYTINNDTATVVDTASNTVVTTIANASGTPIAAAMNAAGTRLYVLADSSPLVAFNRAVVVIDTVANVVVTATQVSTTFSSTGNGLTITPDGQRVVVSLGADAALFVMDTASNAALGSIPLSGVDPRAGVALTDNRHLYILCQSSNTICVVDLATSTSPDAPISRTGAFIALLTFRPDGGAGFAKGGFIRELVVSIDTVTNTARPNIVIPRAPSRSFPQVLNLVVDRASGATLAADNSRQLVFADTTTGAITGVLTTAVAPSRLLLASPDGTRVYEIAGSSLDVIDAVNKADLTVFAIGGNAADALLSLDGSRIYVADSTNNAVKVISTAGPTLLTTIPVGTTPARVVLAAGGQTLLTLNTGSPTVSVIDLATNTVTGTIPLAGTSFGDLVALPTGPRAFLVNRTNNRVDVLDPSQLTVLTSIAMSPAPDFLAVPPDGSRLFAVQAQAGAVTAIDATTAAVLGSLTFPVRGNGLGRPVFAPNGRVYIPRRDFDSVLVLE